MRMLAAKLFQVLTLRSGRMSDDGGRMRAGKDVFFLMFLFTVLAIVSGVDLYRQGTFKFDTFTFEIGFSSAVFIISLVGIVGTICESPLFMAIMTVLTMATAFTALGYVVHITYIFYMVEDNIEELRKKTLLNLEVRKEIVDEQVYVLFALPYMIMMCVSFAITGLTSVIFDYYTM